jgi:hypothetical protein
MATGLQKAKLEANLTTPVRELASGVRLPHYNTR